MTTQPVTPEMMRKTAEFKPEQIAWKPAPMMPTGSQLADDYLAWLEDKLTKWVAANPGETILGLNSYANDSPTVETFGASIRTPTSGFNFSEDKTKGVTVLTPVSNTFESPGGSGSFTVTASAGSVWTPVPDQPWVTAAINGTTPTQVDYTVGVNPDPQGRNAGIKVGGASGQTMTFMVYQNAAPAVRR